MNRPQHPPIASSLPDVTTERLHLRRLRRDDLDALAPVFAKVEVWRFPYGRGFTRAETDAFLSVQVDAWDRYGFGLWLACLRGTGDVLGFVGISIPTFLPEILPAIEVGWRLDPVAWGNGYATEGARAALAESFQTLRLTEVVSVPQSDNPPSVRVCERLGMRFEREVVIPADSRRGALRGSLFRMSRHEWAAQRDPASQ
jgi:RimJ/RimL family protein N-acetyltransferase